MKQKLNMFFMAAFFYGITSSMAMAGKTTLTESRKDALKCYSFEGEQSCEIVTTGKFTVVAFISGDSFDQRGITFDTISPSTHITMSVGGFIFSKTLGEAPNLVLNSKKLSATWKETHEECNANDICKSVVDTTVSIGASSNSNGPNGLSIKITGTNKSDSIINYGSEVFATTCSSNNNGYLLNDTASLSVDNEVFSATLSGSCKTKIATKVKNGESFSLESISDKAIANYLD
jgi:hypothetical protein